MSSGSLLKRSRTSSMASVSVHTILFAIWSWEMRFWGFLFAPEENARQHFPSSALSIRAGQSWGAKACEQRPQLVKQGVDIRLAGELVMIVYCSVAGDQQRRLPEGVFSAVHCGGERKFMLCFFQKFEKASVGLPELE
uniref:Uncharacterized protein n=1 Tax=Rhodosorus marinus TaxID=101924 RepID=A0A7S2ZD25_9RHOD|mmetsp:Transcript_15016/g.61248  ORF Transcript_15016/g.61248 Transcript_15016/m.61248 type:complete len:138 (+) Transcript_15016:370-783(+)